ncbi:hypothetical protein [uncultured Sphingomonas sp.]|uniref:hypothetical protein n=1 Tax=uncultured Sphingomonas sp. TaxID=158754 RepID=UPI002596B349|nr:hypothetical protein [uncultured Sphingomonas sp.]
MKPDLSSALADSSFVYDGGPAWTVERALDIAARNGVEQMVAAEHHALQAAKTPPPGNWLADRLTILWTMFMASRAADPRSLAVWMAETASLLSDLPHDIVAYAVDEAIRKSRHGFIPSVGEIRQFAEPLVDERNRHIERLGSMAAALADPAATATRQRRRQDAAARAQFAADNAALARLERAKTEGRATGFTAPDSPCRL